MKDLTKILFHVLFILYILLVISGIIGAFCGVVLLILEKIKNKGAIKNWVVSMMVVYIIFTLLGYGLSFHAV